MNGVVRGFTLVELLVALTLAAIVATSALGALGMFAEADAALVHGTESEVDAGRALRLLRADVQAAATLDVQSRQWSITRHDGTFPRDWRQLLLSRTWQQAVGAMREHVSTLH
mgnify:CR=1 FL=1